MTTVHYQIPPRPTLDAHRAMSQMQEVLQGLGITSDPRTEDWSVDARVYQRGNGGHGPPSAAVCLRLHEPTRGRLCWLYETPARGAAQWATPSPAGTGRRLELLVDGTAAIHPGALAPVRLLLNGSPPC